MLFRKPEREIYFSASLIPCLLHNENTGTVSTVTVNEIARNIVKGRR